MLASALSLLACAAVVVVWARSGGKTDVCVVPIASRSGALSPLTRAAAASWLAIVLAVSAIVGAASATVLLLVIPITRKRFF